MRRANWCADCWAAAEDACRDAHRLVDREAAGQDAQAELARVQADAAAELARVQRRHAEELARAQGRLEAVSDERALAGPVIQANVEPNEEHGYTITGGPILLALATTEANAEEKEAICRQLEGLVIRFEKHGNVYSGRVDVKALGGLMAKLPDFVKGQAVQSGTVLLDGKGKLDVYSSRMTWRGDVATKEFGFVQSDLDVVLEYTVCDNYCKPLWNCCCTTDAMGRTTLSGVKFQDD